MNPDVPVASTLQLQFGSDFVVLVFDAHNGLHMSGTKYTGLQFVTASGNTVFDEYRKLMEELTSFLQVVYGYSPCWERFDMDRRLGEEAHVCAALATAWGHITYDLSDFWESIRPFCLNMESDGKLVNLWHHTDYNNANKRHYFWDQLVKKLVFLAVANSWGGTGVVFG